MRLLQLRGDDDFSLAEYGSNNIPRYAILSHTWESKNDEVTFEDVMESRGKDKRGYRKLTFCGKQAKQDGLQHFWVDTCCINKSSSQELSEAINSMFHWYKNAERCYAYLSDVSNSTSSGGGECTRRWKPAFKKSKWFTRGWTLQELIAPSSVEFFSREGECLGNKQSLEQTVHEVTGIAVEALRGRALSLFSMEERFSWAKGRMTTREEDEAYCLLGIFDIQIPLIYAEGREKALKRLKKEIRDRDSNDQVLSLNEEQKRMLLESLRFDQIDARQMTIKNAHIKTCKWLLRKPEYVDWLNAAKRDEHHGFLWIKGKPGTGKSTLMKFAVTNARKKMKDDFIISFFFNARGEDIEKSTIGTYRSLLLQLLEQLPALKCVFDSLGLSTLSIKTHKWTMESLKIMLAQAIESLGESSVVCFIDALDECEEGQIRDMIQFLEDLSARAMSSSIRFRVCFASRHYPHITIQKSIALVLEGQEEHSQDITNYLESELKIGKSNLAQRIRMELQEKASGIFMWVVLVIGILNKEYDGGRIHVLRQRLQEIPGDLHELFRDILTRDSYHRGELLLCIQWILFSKRPLSPEELYFAILSGVESKAPLQWDPTEITKDDMQRFILGSSKGLAEVTTSRVQKVQFIHESVRDFLLKEDGLATIWPNLANNFQGQSQERLKRCCLSFVNVDTSTFPEFNKSQATAQREKVSSAFPFLEYAVRNVLYHADIAAGLGITQDVLFDNFPLDHWIVLNNLFEKADVRRHTKDVSLLYILAEGNLSNLIRVCPSILSCLKATNERYGPPLFAALATRSEEAVQVFLEAILGTQPLQSVFHSLRQDGGKRHTIGRTFTFPKQTPVLSFLLELGEEALFAFELYIRNAEPDVKDKKGSTVLSYAARNGQESAVKLLLATGQVDVDSKTNNGRTPLSWAAAGGHEAVVKLLLATGQVDVDSKTNNGRTPLSWAAEGGHEAVVKLLLATGQVDVDSKDNGYGRTPLSWAAAGGHEAVVKLLLATGQVDVDSKDNGYGRTPLSWAAAGGHEAVVKLLLATGQVDVDSKTNNGRTPLSWAAAGGHEAVVKLLLATGQVDVDSKTNNYGQTPLSWAAAGGHEAVVKLLLATGQVDVDSKDNNGQTPLSWAAEGGHEAVVKLLLATGQVDVDSKTNNGRTPLSWAAERGHEAVVKLLNLHLNVSL